MLLEPGEKVALPTLKYPPYISVSAYMYRIGPMNKNDIESILLFYQLHINTYFIYRLSNHISNW